MSELPSFLQNFTDRLGSNLGTRAQPHLSIEGDRLTLIDSNGDSETVMTRIEKGQAKGDEQIGDPCLDCVIIDGGDHPSQIYFGRPYDPKGESFAPPMCWSDNGIAPSVNCSEPQAVSCTPDPTGQNGCKWAVWGSGRAAPGSKVIPPACAKYQKLAIMIPGDDIQFQLRVPPNSLVQLDRYNAKFKGQPFTMLDVVTRVSIRAKTLHFTGVRPINDAEKAQRAEIWATKKTDALVGRGDKPRGAPAIAGPTNPAPTVSLPAPAPAEPTPDPLFQDTGASTASPSTAAPVAPTRRRGRPPKEAVPVAANDFNGLPGAAPQAPFPHGVTQAPAPNADLEASLKSVFG
jgi:hypothetical protein